METFYTGTPGAVINERVVVGGYQTMADGQIAKLYPLNVYGTVGSYNSVTGNGYRLDDNTPFPTDWIAYLIVKRKILVWELRTFLALAQWHQNVDIHYMCCKDVRHWIPYRDSMSSVVTKYPVL